MRLANDIQVYLKTTETCNLNCSHCFTSGSQGKKIFFDPVQSAHYIQKIYDDYKIRSCRIMYHGGEPMLAPHKNLMKFYDLTSYLPNIDYGIQTNLVYRLTDKKLEFFETVLDKKGIGTSWDSNIRFGSNGLTSRSQDLQLWEDNVRYLNQNGYELTLLIGLCKNTVTNFEPEELLDYAIDLGFPYILFERLTYDGNAEKNPHIFPHNSEIDRWLMKMYIVTIKNNYHQKIKNMFLDEIAKSFKFNMHVANRCRNCEQKLITMNADGSLSGCPNSAPTQLWGHISKSTNTFVENESRLNAICSEQIRPNGCLTCEVKEFCFGDCYKLQWDDSTCAAPKSLFKHLVNSRYHIEDLLI